MRKFWIILLLAGWWMTGGALSQEEKPEAAVAPIAFLGNVSQAKIGIIFNKFQEKLTQRYNLISQQKFEQAQEEAFKTLDMATCTDEHCIRKIQELLQVERLFVLQVIEEEGFTQLSLTLVTLEDTQVKTDLCEGCNIGELNRRIAQLADQLLGVSTPPPPVAAPTVGDLEILTTPPGAAISVDDQPQRDTEGTELLTPARLKLPFGPHHLVLRLNNYLPHEFDISVSQSQLPPQKVTLKQEARIILKEVADAVENHSGSSAAAGQQVTQYLTGNSLKSMQDEIRLSPQGTYNLGMIYRKGYGLDRNDAQAVFWWQRSAEQGNEKAQNRLGFMFDHGLGVKEDDRQAAAWYQKAATQGLAVAQFNLASMYRKGYGVSQDLGKAQQLYQQAASRGNKDAKEVLAWLSKQK
ncbi:tetratricopeptide repeat protein [Deltaproteobacteria bacterium TL4]